MRSPARFPNLLRYYRVYLDDTNSADFIQRVARQYTVASLERLADYGQREPRRAACLALGFLGDFGSNGVLGRRLTDSDRGVRIVADNGIRALWCRDGSETQQLLLRKIVRLNQTGQVPPAREFARELIDQAPRFAEAWNQRAQATFQQGEYTAAANDFLRTLELNPYHFLAAVQLAQCYLELDDGLSALECLRRGLKLNPSMERVRLQVSQLRRALKKRR